MKTDTIKSLVSITLLLLLNVAHGVKFIPLGLERETVADNEFVFSFVKDGLLLNVSGIKAFQLQPPRHRLLGMRDVGVSLALIIQEPGFVIPLHVHPRGSENYASISGRIEITTTLEGIFNTRRVVSVLPPAHASSIPQGLPHTVKCVSTVPCVYHSFFNTADPGFARILAPV